jgi:hypothetical protein
MEKGQAEKTLSCIRIVLSGFSRIVFTFGFPGFKNLSKSGPKQSDRANAGISRK